VSFAGGGIDRLHGWHGRDVLDGGDDSMIDDGLGDDVLFGGAGDDFLQDRYGHNIMVGGAGRDVMRGTGIGDPWQPEAGTRSTDSEDRTIFVFEPCSGRDQIRDLGADDLIDVRALGITDRGQILVSPTQSSGSFRLDFAAGSSVTFLWSTIPVSTLAFLFADPALAAAGERVSGTAGDDALTGGDGADWIRGGLGADVLAGGSGDDGLDGGEGDDTIDGGIGDDRLFGGAGADLLLGGEGDDRLVGEAGDDRLEGAAGNDRLEGGDGADDLHGHEDDDPLEGGRGNDALYAHDGADALLGGDGDDTLYAHDGADTLDGGAGADLLWGGADDDLLSGGAGADVFVFADPGDGGGSGHDWIVDFDALDLLDVSALGIAGLDEVEVAATDYGLWLGFGSGSSVHLEGAAAAPGAAQFRFADSPDDALVA